MRPQRYTISRQGPGRLSTMARPRGGDWLVDEINGLATTGVGVLVSLLSDPEVGELGLNDEQSLARAMDIEFIRLPTLDRQVPDAAACIDLAKHLRRQLVHRAHVAIHCRNGIGRASTLAAAILVLEGVTPADAWQRIAQARALAVPDTEAQRHFIDMLDIPDH